MQQNDFDLKTKTALNELKNAIEQSSRIAVLTGAGVSVPSGIPDFRSATGLYATSVGKYRAEYIISHDFFMLRPDDFYVFYKSKMCYPNAEPNAMHRLLARLEKAGKINAVVTQNIDGLHQKAGSERVCELHGSVWRNYCERCGKSFSLDYVLQADGTPHCDCGGIIKPDVVLYGENLDEKVLRNSVRAISTADLFIVIGTSLVVYPAAGLVNYFGGNTIALVNKSATYIDSRADIVINQDCEKVAKWLDENLVL